MIENNKDTLEIKSKKTVKKTYFLKRNESQKGKKFVIKVNEKENCEIEVHKTESIVSIFAKK